MKDSLYFRIVRPDSDHELFDEGWTEIPATLTKFILNRSVWRAEHVSSNDQKCVELYFDPQNQRWQMWNWAPDRTLILYNGLTRFDLPTKTATSIEPAPTWTGTLTGAFSFELTHTRPRSVERVHCELPPPGPGCDAPTLVRRGVIHARDYLARHNVQRLALAYMWQEYLIFTPDNAAEWTTDLVARDFGEKGKTITTWRGELTEAIYGKGQVRLNRDVREFVRIHGLMNARDVAEAYIYIAKMGNKPGQQQQPSLPAGHLQAVPPNRGREADHPTTYRRPTH